MDNLSEFIEQLRCSNKLIIVEGKKDRLALEKFGIRKIKEIDNVN